MNNLNTQSVMKAAGIGAAINGLIGLLSVLTLLVPDLAILTWPFLCCGGFLVPIIAGALYGRFTPGQETMSDGAIGGAVSGFAAGLAYGIVSSIATSLYTIVQGGDIGAALAGTATGLLTSCCVSIIFGGILGAVGGAIWVMTQGNKGR